MKRIIPMIRKLWRWLRLRGISCSLSSWNFWRRSCSFCVRNRTRSLFFTCIITLVLFSLPIYSVNMLEVRGGTFYSKNYLIFHKSLISGSMLVFSIVANSIVHIIMYSYYFISAYDVAIFKFIAGKVKKYITSIQLVSDSLLVVHNLVWCKRTLTVFFFQIQFALLTANNVLGLQPGCNTCKPFLAMYIPNVFILMYLFSDFYKKSYDKKQSKVK